MWFSVRLTALKMVAGRTTQYVWVVFSSSDCPPEALPVCERPLDQVTEDCQVPEGKFRPQRLPGSQRPGAALPPLPQ